MSILYGPYNLDVAMADAKQSRARVTLIFEMWQFGCCMDYWGELLIAP
jgi:hypothetical protein